LYSSPRELAKQGFSCTFNEDVSVPVFLFTLQFTQRMARKRVGMRAAGRQARSN
jgi:hypothetical protein